MRFIITHNNDNDDDYDDYDDYVRYEGSNNNSTCKMWFVGDGYPTTTTTT